MIKKLINNGRFWYWILCVLVLLYSSMEAYLLDRRVDYFISGVWVCWVVVLAVKIFFKNPNAEIIKTFQTLVSEQQQLNKNLLQSLSEATASLRVANNLLEKYRRNEENN